MNDDANLSPELPTSPVLIVIACSAGSLNALFETLSGLARDFPAAIAVIQHRGAQHPNLLVDLLKSRVALEVRHARDGDRLEAGVVYVCPPGVHMATEHSIRLFEGPKLRYVQPSADVMLRSTAVTHGNRAIGVVLSGAGSDGALGARLLAEAGGTMLVQDPLSCEFPSMPAAAMAAGGVSLVLQPNEMAAALQRYVELAASNAPAGRPPLSKAIRVLLADDHRITRDGLAAMLGREKDIDVVGEADDGAAAVALALQLQPDVVVMDVAMPEVDGIAATRMIRGKRASIAVVALSANSDWQTAQQMLSAGALGYVCKTDAFTELATAIRCAAERRPYLSPRIPPMPLL